VLKLIFHESKGYVYLEFFQIDIGGELERQSNYNIEPATEFMNSILNLTSIHVLLNEGYSLLHYLLIIALVKRFII